MRTCLHCHNDAKYLIGGFCWPCQEKFMHQEDVPDPQLKLDFDLTTCTFVVASEKTDSEEHEEKLGNKLLLIMLGICPSCGESCDVEYLEKEGFCYSCNDDLNPGEDSRAWAVVDGDPKDEDYDPIDPTLDEGQVLENNQPCDDSPF